MEITLKPVETLLFRSDIVALGTFRCPAVHPLYRDSGPCTHHSFCFPRTSTVIRHAEGTTFVGSPNSASLYNEHQMYSREKIDDIDATDWIVLTDDVLLDLVRAFDESIEERAGRPFRHAHAPLDAGTYLDQRRLFESWSSIDVFEIEEAAIAIAGRVLASAYRKRPLGARGRDRAEAVKSLIAKKPAANFPLRSLARAVDTSPFHLCRAFRSLTGMSITEYRHSLRLRLALQMLRERTVDVTGVALELGYSSHSHFTAMFRRHFGITPSQFRDSGRGAADLRFANERSALARSCNGRA